MRPYDSTSFSRGPVGSLVLRARSPRVHRDSETAPAFQCARLRLIQARSVFLPCGFHFGLEACATYPPVE